MTDRVDHLALSAANDAAANAAFTAKGWPRSHGVLYRNTTDAAYYRWDDTAGVWTSATGGGGAFPGIELEQVLFVDEGSNATEDGSGGAPYQTIAAAYTQAKTLAPTVTNPVTVFIWGGVYDENLTLDTDYINLVGIGRDSVLIRRTGGTDPTITLDSVTCTISDVTIEHTVNGEPAIFSSSVCTLRINRCYIKSQGNVVAAAPMSITNGFNLIAESCDFIGDTDIGWNFHCASDDTYLRFTDCNLYGGNVNSTAFEIDTVTDLLMTGCRFTAPGSDVRTGYAKIDSAGGDLTFFGCSWDMSPMNQKRCMQINGASPTVRVLSCQLDGGYIEPHAAGIVLTVMGCKFRDNAGSYDIGGAATLTTPARVFDNDMDKGMSYRIRIRSPIKRVCGRGVGWGDFYNQLSDAIMSIYEDDNVVLLEDDHLVMASIEPPAYKFTIDGQGEFGITRGNGQTVLQIDKVSDITCRGLGMPGAYNLNEGGAKLRLVDQCHCTGLLDVQAGCDNTSILSVEDSTLEGNSADLYCIDVNDSAAYIYVVRSYLKGYTENPAIDNPEDNAHIHIAYSMLMHGALAANSPLAAPGTPAYSSHHNMYNADPSGAGYANNIASPFDCFDPDGDWGWGM